MPLAEKLNEKEREQEQAIAEGRRGHLLDPSPVGLMQLRNVLKAIHWMGYKRLLEDAELVIANDRQWTMLRKRIMDTANEKEREMMAVIGKLLAEQKESNGQGSNGGQFRG